MALYQLTSSVLANNVQPIIRETDGAHIPPDQGNADFQAYLIWLTAGNAPDPATSTTPVYTCQLWQLEAAMTTAQWSAAQTAIQNLNNAAVSAFFAHGSNVIPSTSTTLLQLGEAIGLTADQIVALVQQASAISIP